MKKEGKKKSLRRFARRVGVGTDIGTTVVLQGAGALLAYLVNRSIARTLGPDGWDAYSLSMLTYIQIGTAVVDFGIVAVAMPRISAARGEFTPALAAAWNLRLITLIAGLIFTVGLTLLYGNTELLLPVMLGFFVVAISGKMTGLRQIPEIIWRLKGRTWIISAITLFDALLLMGVLQVLAHTGGLTLLTVMLALIVTNIPGFFIVLLPILSGFRESGYFRRRIPKRYYRGLLAAALPVGVMAVTSQLFGRVEPLVINAALGPEYVGDYVAGILPLAGTLFFAIAVGLGLWPLISQIHRRVRNDITAEWVISAGSRLLGGIAILISMGCLLFSEQIMAIFDPAYVQYAYILRIYSITNGLEYLVVFFDQTLLAVERRREMMIGTLLSLGLALIFQFGAISQWGITGILVGKIAALCCKIIYQLWVLGGEIRVGALKAFARLTGAAVPPATALVMTSSLGLVPRTAIVFSVAVASLLALRIVDLKELKVLRGLRLT